MGRREIYKDINATIGQRLKEIRKKRKMSTMKLGNLVGITFQQIQKYENGTNNLSVGRLIDISNALGVSPCIFLGDFKDPPRPDIPVIHEALKLTSQATNLLNSIKE